MSEFHDPDLRQQLGRLSGPYPDDNEAFAAWQRRVGQVQRRRAVAWTTGAALSLIVGIVAFAAVQTPDRQSVVPGKSAESTDVSITVASTEVEAEVEAEDPTTVPEVTASEVTEPSLASDTTPTSEVVETEVPEATEAAGSPSNTPPTTKGHNGSPTPVTPAPSQSVTQTFASEGGSITVRMEGDRLTVIATNPASGFEAKDTDDSGEKVGVTFKSEEHESQISVRISDGIMKPSIDEEDREARDKHDTTVPEESDGDRDRDRGRDD